MTDGLLSLDEVGAAGLDTVVIAGVDLYGRLFGKRLPIRAFERVIETGLNVCTSVYAWDIGQDMNSLKVEFAGAHTGWNDFRLMPDIKTLRRAAWLEGTAICLADAVDMHSDKLLAIAPRTVLRRQIQRLATDQLTAYTATELEFYLYHGTPDDLRHAGYRDLKPTTTSHQDYAIGATNAMEPFFRTLRHALEASGIPIEVSQAEYGLGQWEINLEYSDALETADRHALYKCAVADMARAHGMTATFMARPVSQGMGSSCHVHASLKSLAGGFPFYDAARPRTVSSSLLYAVGGVLDRADELMAFYAPTVNSMRRILSQDFSGNGATWGYDNRTTTCRVLYGAPETNRLEMRLPGADVNPYLVTAAVLASMRDGISRIADPGDPVEGDGYCKHSSEAPSTLGDAARLLTQSDFAVEAFDKSVVNHYAALAQHEWLQFLTSVSDWDRERYLEGI